MKILKFLLFIISSSIILFLLISLLLPSIRSVQYSITINQPVDSVYKRVVNLHEWQDWNPWNLDNTDANNSYAVLIGSPGSRWIWSGSKMGEGELIIKSTEPDCVIKANLRLQKPEQIQSDITWYFVDMDTKTEVKWVNNKKLNYPFGRWAGLRKYDAINSNFDKGLHNLKEFCEKRL